MKLLRGLKQIDLLPDGVAATIGNFDGMHRGHQALLATLSIQAKRLACPVLVILFEPQPSEYFQRNQAPARLMSLREKLNALKTLGVDYVCCLKFNEILAHMSANSFAEQAIFKSLRVNYLLVGVDFRFGKDRLGDVDFLVNLGKKHGCKVESFSDYKLEQRRISSTAIRNALAQGDLNAAAAFLGHPYNLCGRVIEGDGRGRQWGIPTANVALRRDKLALSGVFTVRVRLANNTSHRGVANIGSRPTVDGRNKLSLEVHIFDFAESIYGELMHIEFFHKIRDEVKFNSIEALIDQIKQDIANAQVHFDSPEFIE